MLAAERDHDRRAAYICLLTAGLAHARTATVIGDSIDGWFWLPPMQLWADRAKTIALYFKFYNFVRVHKTSKCSSAIAAGLSTTLWSMEDIVALIDARAEKPKARGAYKPRQWKAA